LVTQLKWRLLEGGGQAYYELGVADSGELVGLKRKEMEMSLGTLEEMAGEIGASVIVVKEIEVTGVVGEKGGSTRRVGDSDESGTTDADTTDVTDVEEGATLDGVMELGSERTGAIFSLDLEIASVFKPRPRRKRIHAQAMGVTSGKKRDKGDRDWSGKAGKGKKHHDPTQGDEKIATRKAKRDKKREEKRKALEGYAGVGPREVEVEAIVGKDDAEAEKLAECLSELHVGMQRSRVVESVEERLPITVVPPPDGDAVKDNIMLAMDDYFLSPADGSKLSTAGSDRDDLPLTVTLDVEPRLIVEALVVRKMSLEEAFLDFGGFTLA
jgi:hypothetical protein